MQRASQRTKEEKIPPIRRYNIEHSHDHEGEDPVSMLRHKRIADQAKRHKRSSK